MNTTQGDDMKVCKLCGCREFYKYHCKECKKEKSRAAYKRMREAVKELEAMKDKGGRDALLL